MCVLLYCNVSCYKCGPAEAVLFFGEERREEAVVSEGLSGLEEGRLWVERGQGAEDRNSAEYL